MANGYTAEQVIEAVKDSRGFVTTIAKRLGCDRTYIYVLAKRFPTVQDAINNERESLKDQAEGKLQQLIEEGNITAIIFYLKTQGRDRGYSEHVEATIDLPVDSNFERALKQAYGKNGNG